MTDTKAAGEIVNPQIAQTERIGLGDLVIAGLLAVATLVISLVWDFPGLLPSVWSDAVVASGVRPAVHILPGYFRFFGSLVYGAFGVNGGEHVLGVVGHVSLMLIAVCVYATLREVLAFVMRARPQFSKQRTIVMQLASAVGSVAFVCADAVWASGQSFCESTILMMLLLGSLEFYFLFLRKGSLKYAYGCAVLLGFLAAESPFGLVLGAVFIGIYSFILKVMPVLESPFFKPALIAVGKWHMTFLFVAALIGGIALNSVTYGSHEGLTAIGASVGDVPLRYLNEYWGAVASAADALGWLLVVAVALAPFLVSIVRFPAAADEEQFLSYSTGIVFLVCGVLAAAQSCALPSLWYWTYCKVSSQFLLCIGSFLSALTLACAMTILGVDSLCRNHRRLAMQVFGGDDEDELVDDEVIEAARTRSDRISRLVRLFLVPLAIVISIVPSRIKTDTREMLSVINDSVVATVDEAGDSEFIFTDGNLDNAIELESARRGGALKCISLIGGDNAMAKYLRTRGLGNDKEDLFSFKHDGGMGLRTWMRDKPAKLAKSSVQLGFDLWKRDGKAIPEIGGFLSRPGVESDPAARRAAIDRANALARRILAIYANKGYSRCTDHGIKSAITALQWRLARMCIYRAECSDLAGDVPEALADMSLATELNDSNQVYKDLVSNVSKQNEMLLTRLTPREGLQLALVRADFTMAKLYAEVILVAEPEHSDANFAMGMYYLKQRQLSRAEEYLKRCLIGKPREPAIYNNLAMLQMELGKFDAALINVDKALAIIPESSAVKDTKKLILKKRAEKLGKEDKENK